MAVGSYIVCPGRMLTSGRSTMGYLCRSGGSELLQLLPRWIWLDQDTETLADVVLLVVAEILFTRIVYVYFVQQFIRFKKI